MEEQFNIQPGESQEKPKNKNVLIIMIVIAVLIFGFAGWWLFKQPKIEGDAFNSQNKGTQGKPKEADVIKTKDEDNNDITTYKYGDYQVVVTEYNDGADAAQIVVSNLENEMLYKRDGVKTLVGDSLREVKPTITNGKLSFVALSNECYTRDGEQMAYVEYITIDLNSSTIKATVTKKVKEYIEGATGNC